MKKVIDHHNYLCRI